MIIVLGLVIFNSKFFLQPAQEQPARSTTQLDHIMEKEQTNLEFASHLLLLYKAAFDIQELHLNEQSDWDVVNIAIVQLQTEVSQLSPPSIRPAGQLSGELQVYANRMVNNIGKVKTCKMAWEEEQKEFGLVIFDTQLNPYKEVAQKEDEYLKTIEDLVSDNARFQKAILSYTRNITRELGEKISKQVRLDQVETRIATDTFLKKANTILLNKLLLSGYSQEESSKIMFMVLGRELTLDGIVKKMSIKKAN
jgi:hypothetical protein